MYIYVNIYVNIYIHMCVCVYVFVCICADSLCPSQSKYADSIYVLPIQEWENSPDALCTFACKEAGAPFARSCAQGHSVMDWNAACSLHQVGTAQQSLQKLYQIYETSN